MLSDVLIEPVFRSSHLFPFLFTERFIVQAEPFRLWFLVTNIGSVPSSELEMKQIQFNSAAGQDMQHHIDKTLHVKILNPGESIKIWCDQLGTYMSGQACVQMTVTPLLPENTVQLHQKDRFANQTSKLPQNNKWLDFCYVRSKAEVAQEKYNNITFILTVLMAIITFLGFQRP